MGLRDRLVNRFFADAINRRVNLAVRALDDPHDRMLFSGESARDRRGYDRQQILEDALEAWRLNPLARRIVELTSDYVVGAGLNLESKDAGTQAFLKRWWNHRLNHMPIRAFELCDELTRAGELFIVVSTDQAGMSYVRAIPSSDITDIASADNDIEQETEYTQTPPQVGREPITWKAYNPNDDGPDESGKFQPVMLHYAVNRPVGAKRGESDLGPILKWITRYSMWLEDRARLNRFRQAFLYIVKRNFTNDAERLARQAQLNASPPNPGSILVTDTSEDWSVLNPKLESVQAGQDGDALKKMVAVGAGVPQHFLAEPEGSTRTTAEQAGGPTFRHYERRQLFFLWMLVDVASVAARRHALIVGNLPKDPEIAATGTDISARDNSQLADAASTILYAFNELHDSSIITHEEFLRIVYKFCGEVIDIPSMLTAAAKQKAQPTAEPAAAPQQPQQEPTHNGQR